MNIVLFTAEESVRPLAQNDERAVHIRSVLHKTVGDTFEAGIINGQKGKAHITHTDSAQLHFTFMPESDCPPLFMLNLIIGFPRPIQLKRLLRSVSSLGAGEIHLTGTDLGEKSYLLSGLSERSKAEAALIDGAVQAKTTRVPHLFFYKSVADCLHNIENRIFGARFSLDTVQPVLSLPDLVRNRSCAGKSVAAAIGSERGWTDSERILLEKAGFIRCGLGARILRTETAAIAATALLLTAMEVI